MDENQLLTDRQVAELFGLNPHTLRMWRMQGIGPPFMQIGIRTIRYRRSAVVRWLDNIEQLSVNDEPPPMAA